MDLPYLFLRLTLKLHNQDSVEMVSLVCTFVKMSLVYTLNMCHLSDVNYTSVKL